MAAVTFWGHLPGESFKVLNYMALITLDRDPEPVYWGKTEALIEALGRKGEPTESDYRALRRAIKPLVDNGAISVDKRQVKGRPPAYRLHLHRTESVR
jgi:hypothetical protein